MKHVLILYHSNAGQTARAIELLEQGLLSLHPSCEAPVIHRARIACEPEQPFPWPFIHFFSIFPDCVRGRAPKIKLEWDGNVPQDVDLVIFASPVWFLSPSLSAHGLFHSEHVKWFQNKPVVTLITSRNMWYLAAREIQRNIKRYGGRIIDSIVLMDRAAPWTTFITTPIWMLTGKKKLKGFPEAGIQPEDFQQLVGWGKTLAQQQNLWAENSCFLKDSHPIALEEKYLLPEVVVKTVLFKPWAALLHGAEPLGKNVNKCLIVCFFSSLLLSILILIPIILLSKILLKLFMNSTLKQLEKSARFPYPCD